MGCGLKVICIEVGIVVEGSVISVLLDKCYNHADKNV